jgi:hypothetical protein
VSLSMVNPSTLIVLIVGRFTLATLPDIAFRLASLLV